MEANAAGAANARPMNVLFITSDQQRGDCFGFEGLKVKTPHLDLLARQGTRFATCITPSNVCQPSRASILTGLLPMNHEMDNLFGDAGYAALQRDLTDMAMSRPRDWHEPLPDPIGMA